MNHKFSKDTEIFLTSSVELQLRILTAFWFIPAMFLKKQNHTCAPDTN